MRSFRKNILSVQTVSPSRKEDGEKPVGGATLVKVSMDGAPYLRKVDLKTYRNYNELSAALETMFSSFTGGKFFNLTHVNSFNKGNITPLKVKIFFYVPIPRRHQLASCHIRG